VEGAKSGTSAGSHNKGCETVEKMLPLKINPTMSELKDCQTSRSKSVQATSVTTCQLTARDAKIETAQVQDLSVCGNLTDCQGNSLIPVIPPIPPARIPLGFAGKFDVDLASPPSFSFQQNGDSDLTNIDPATMVNTSDYGGIRVHVCDVPVQSILVLTNIHGYNNPSTNFGDIAMEVFAYPVATVIPGTSPVFAAGLTDSAIFTLEKVFTTPLPAFTPFVVGFNMTGTAGSVTDFNFNIFAVPA